MDKNQEMNQEKSQEEMVKEAVEEAKKRQRQQENAEDRRPAEEETGAETAEDVPEDGQEPEDGSEEEPSEDGQKKNKFFGKKNKKDKKDEKIEELTDKLTRQMAEFDNFRKRTEREKSQMYEVGAKDIIEKILPVVDNFERGLAAVAGEEKENPFVQGMEKVYKQLMTTLEEAWRKAHRGCRSGI